MLMEIGIKYLISSERKKIGFDLGLLDWINDSDNDVDARNKSNIPDLL